jgi:chemotaxis protein histidine kinase CheA
MNVERLDSLFARGGAPDAEVFARDARALRGSATMAKVSGIADVAAGLERIAKGLRDGSLAWSDALRGAVIAAVDDLKILIRGVRTWGSEEERRAADRAEELQALAPAGHRRSGAAPSVGGGSAGFLAAETAEVAAGLRRLADDTGRSVTFTDTLRRLRALRGVAALLDLPPLAEVVAGVDETAKALELGSAAPSDAQRTLFRAAAVVLREGSDAVQAGGRPDPASSAVEAFAAAAELVEASTDTDLVVPIRSLFPDDGGAHILHASPNPPTTPAKRFRLEAVSQAEHLRRLVSDARRAADALTRGRLGRELRSAVRSLAAAAESYAEFVVARALYACVDGASGLEPRVLAALDEASAILSTSGDAPLGPRFEALAGTAPTPIRASTPIRAAAPLQRTSPPASIRAATPSTPAAPSSSATH